MLPRPRPQIITSSSNHASSLRWVADPLAKQPLREVWLHYRLTILPLDRPIHITALVAELDLLLTTGFGCAPCCGSHWLSAGTAEPLLEISQWDRAVRLAVPIDEIAPITVDCAEFRSACQSFVDRFQPFDTRDDVVSPLHSRGKE